MARILIHAFGSYGDIHPYMGLALELARRGHAPVIATSPIYRQKIESEGIAFRAIRPDLPRIDRELMRQVFDRRKGTEFIFRHILMPNLRNSYEDLAAVAESPDVIITHPVAFAGPLLARVRGIPWISTVLAPASFMSADDPPAFGGLPFPEFVSQLGRGFHRAFYALADRMSRSWLGPYRELEAELGLKPGANPIFAGQHSPQLVLGLFSPLLAAPQPDWPPQARATGFVFFDRDEVEHPPAPELEQFLKAGSAPLVFTLGSAAVQAAGNFFEESAKAARLLRQRAVLLVGKDMPRPPAELLSSDIAAFDYAPFSQLFPRAAVIVHQGGIGTTAQAMRSGRPALVMPLSHDQFDNAVRSKRLGIARLIGRRRFRDPKVASELRILLENLLYAQRAADTGAKIQAEDGVGEACDAIEEFLRVPQNQRRTEYTTRSQ
ncbi:MAG TPA: glycosyltransferase [Terriglobales bacterium]|nr:glycosyltransferase [Terriglobales bacterium]